MYSQAPPRHGVEDETDDDSRDGDEKHFRPKVLKTRFKESKSTACFRTNCLRCLFLLDAAWLTRTLPGR